MTIYQDRTCYVYVVKFIHGNRLRWYIGSRYGRGCHPDDFWKTYTTSSVRIKQIRAKYGDGVLSYKIVRTFGGDPKAAQAFERHFIIRAIKRGLRLGRGLINESVTPIVNVEHAEDQNVRHSLFMSGRRLSEEHKAKISSSLKGIKHSAEAIEKLRETKRRTTVIGEEQRRKMSLAKKGRKLSPEHRESMRQAQLRRWAAIRTQPGGAGELG